MEKLDQKNINKTVLTLINRAMKFKIESIIEDSLSDYDDESFMAQSVNNQASCELEDYLKEFSEKDFYNVYFEEYVEEKNNDKKENVKKNILSKVERLIYNNEKDIFDAIKDAVRRNDEDEINSFKFKKIRI